ncbi:MAG: DnaJ domain-containing protein, partial [Myxococcaceae bacterium]|nr:DnaJ domain-containing protein [Myxococcaceae bacterium]
MKPTRAQTYYELLEVSVSASREQIQQAYARLVQLCADQELALYGLASPAHAAELRAQLTEALEFLSDDELRAEYDRSIGLPPREKPASTAPQVPFTYEAPRSSAPPPVTEQLLPSNASSSAPAAAAEVVVSVSAAPSAPRAVPEPRPEPEPRPAPEVVVAAPEPAALVVRPPPSAAPEVAEEAALAIARSS